MGNNNTAVYNNSKYANTQIFITQYCLQNDAGGEVEIIESKARHRFSGSASHGVESESSGEYIRSFLFAVTPSVTSSTEGVSAGVSTAAP